MRKAIMQHCARGARRLGTKSINKPESYGYFQTITTRWKDNDMYGHVNNVVYYSWFDTVINTYLINHGGLKPDLRSPDPIGLCVSSQCTFLKATKFPNEVKVGLRVEKIGRSSVTYGLGIFDSSMIDLCAHGHFTHVFVDPGTMTSTPIPTNLRNAMEKILVDKSKL